MSIYRINNETLSAAERTMFAREGLRERQDLHALLKSNIEVISPATLIVPNDI